MKKFFKIILSVVLCLSFFTLYVNAHPGRTDSRGGHRNHSTGEYHYHHGYSAHDHYDMDGDGVIDCPYEFDDKTNHNNNSSSNSNNSSITSNKTNNSTTTSENNTEKTKDKKTVGEALGIVLLVILFSPMTLGILCYAFGLIGIIIEWFNEKCFKIRIEESISERIFHISLIIGFVISVLLEILWIFGTI